MRWLRRLERRPPIEVSADLDALALAWVAWAHQEEVRKLIRNGRLRPLLPFCSPQTGPWGPLWCVRGGGRGLPTEDGPGVPLLSRSTVLGEAIVRWAHHQNHEGVDATVGRARRCAWVLRAADIARRIISSCYTCRLLKRQVAQQVMASLPLERRRPAAPFEYVATDIFGPFAVRDVVQRRVSRDVFGILFVCRVSTAVHLESIEDLTAASVVMAVRRFLAIRGAPKSIMSDPGTQLVAAAGTTKLWKAPEIAGVATDARIRWEFIPAGSQHRNGLAERFVGMCKRTLTMALNGVKCTKGELDTLLAETAMVINGRPLRVSSSAPDVVQAVTPNDLILGHTGQPAPINDYEQERWVPARLRFMGEVTRRFWGQWTVRVLPNIMRAQKWHQSHPNVGVGDVVLILYDSRVTQQYKLGRVVAADPDDDGKVRTVTVQYCKLGGAGGKHEVRRSVHTVVPIVPIDEQ